MKLFKFVGIFFVLVSLCVMTSLAEFSDRATYIVALKEPATEEKFHEAKADIEKCGGKVTYEFHSALKALLVSFPKDKVSVLEKKSYVDFIEEDKEVHTW
ncbi:uncharacterized protein BYT42DRAFT_565638 [Radiomyces spectabilis]|uniref:uncharacterized protein n=1 Tax=Radiomyces spectabilis TaxID=64574 RepID=UPI00222083ED|nr:uncharacterized protein BYT42DRAFT_565638 [Radiomyces spectabilis]KAI8381193.1 hypothetical protein BYT42DRAFT_565638 [Radiomyces spectabilis]